MSATIVVGGQYGSEGKGKVVALLASRLESPWLVRCGGPNSGHTVTIHGQDLILRQVPSCADHSTATLCIAAGCAVDENILIEELDILKIERDRIIVDPRAVLISEEDRESERQELQSIASTCSGTGAAAIRRMARGRNVRLVKDSAPIAERCRIESVAPLLHKQIDHNGGVVVEGTQGFGLSLLHGPHYPFVTSRDTTAAGFAMEVGLSPRMIDKIVMVLRTFPIRVGGPSGPFAGESSWEEIASISGAPEVIPEYTSVTKRLRRVAHFDLEAVKVACQYNCPTGLAVMGLDRIDYANAGVTAVPQLTETARTFLDELQRATGVGIEFIGTGFRTNDAIHLLTSSKQVQLAHA
jgi:adenylosuccinate synthase